MGAPSNGAARGAPPPPRRSRLAAGTTVLALCAGYLGALAAPAGAQAGDGAVTVRVVRKVTADGLWQGAALEPGMGGVTVTLTDDAGTSIDGTTAADGTVTLNAGASGLTGGKYRVQVLNPKPGVLFSAFADRQGLDGAPNRLSSTEEFVDLSGGKKVSYTTGLWNPGDYCQKNAPLVTACIRSEVPPADPATRTLVTFPYNARGDNNQTTDLATKTQTGAVYGIGWNKQQKRIFSGAHAHRGSAYGPGGPGGIYLTDRATGATTLYTTVPNTGTTAHNYATDMDLAFAPAVGKEALGDVEVSEDGKDLYVVNLKDRQLYRYDATVTSATAPKAVYPIPGPSTPCPADGDWRPYGLGVQDGVVYVGGVCSGESTKKAADLRAVVRTFDPAAGTFGPVILDQKLDYPRPVTYSVAPCAGAGWFPWSDTVPTTQNGTACGTGYYANPEPMLADIVVDTDGALILSFRDRLGDQVGHLQPITPGGPATVVPSAGGGMSRACAAGDGTFVMAENLGCGKTGARGQGYYGQQRTAYHQNALFSGIALSKVETTIASSALDPDDVTTYTGGTAFTNRDGTRPAGGQMGNRLTSTFGKGGSMADLEVLCDEAPLQIGNRVWYDTDRNGVQDPGEKPVPGATVRLYDANGAVVGTTKTTARGEYYFDDTNVTGGLKPRTAYTVKVDLPADYAPGGPLYQWTVTKADAGGNDFVDNDGKVPPGGTYPEISLVTGGPGENNHTYDFGYVQPEGAVTVTKTDPQGNPLAGAKFQLWKDTDGTAGINTGTDTKVGTECTTGADGKCTATVPLGTYYWQETAAPGGYLLPDQPFFGPLALTMDTYRAGVTTTAVDRPMTGQVSVLKTDPDGKALPGAVFQLWKESNGTPGLQPAGATPDTMVNSACTTGADGRCSATVGLGSYYWQETAAPAGYLLPDPAVFGPLDLTSANFRAGVSVTVTDRPMTGQVSVLKTDPDGKALSGAKFQLWKDTDGVSGLQPATDSKVGAECTTGADGKCAATVGLGTYYWQETAAPAGYLLPEQDVFGPLVLTADNYRAGLSTTAVDRPITGRVQVLKTDPDGKALSGAKFQLWKDTDGVSGLQPATDTKVGAECTTGADGKCAATVGLGTYYWQETAAPDGYLLPDPAVFGPLTLAAANATEGVTATAVNRPAPGSVTVHKTDPEGQSLAGAKFQLWRDSDGTTGLQPATDTKVGAECTTGADGICTATVDPGTYYWQETAAPDGFLLPDNPVFGPLVLTVDNSRQGVTTTAVDRPMTGRVQVLKTDPDGKALSGAVFQLWRDSDGTAGLQPATDSKVGAECTTGADGTCAETVGLGTYYWQETAAPAGYLLPDPAVFGPLTLTSANYRAGVSTTVVDRPMTGAVSVTKVDPQGKPLAGAKFQLWQDTDGTAGLQPATDTKVGTECTTGADGKCAATVGLGTYYWQETAAPSGYLLPAPAVFGPLTLTADNFRQGVTATVTDQPITGRVSVLKTDPDGKALSGAKFQLWQDADGVAGLQPATDTKVGAECTTGADGRCSATVGLGSYYWQETAAPDGYLLPDPAVFGPLTLTAENAEAGLSSTVVDRPAPGEVSVLKTDPQGKPLDGAVFQLWRESGAREGLQQDADTKTGAPCTATGGGRCAATVELGTYYWEEIQAPAGYRLPDNPVSGPLTLTLANARQGVTVTVVDQPITGRVQVLKTDPEGKALSGAKFQLWQDTDGASGLQPATDSKVGAECTTGADGKCAATVGLGSYYWQETAAPAGYLLPAPAVFGPLTLTAENAEAGVSSTVVDRPAPGEVSVLKTDPDGKALSGAVFQLWKDTDGTAGLQPATDTKVGAECRTPADGRCTAGVELGSYYWQEVSAPVGYQLPDPAVFGPLTLTVENARAEHAVTVVDRPLPGYLHLLKRDADTRAALAGAEFRLWRESNGTDGLQPDGDTEVGAPCTTDQDGGCHAGPLPAGRYYWQETKAPAGYLLPEQAVTPVTLAEGVADPTASVTVDNRREPTPPPPVPPTPPVPPRPPLPDTGTSAELVGALSALLLATGGALLGVRSRRRRGEK
ncbi:SpaA isopeptide-forming pilin-related protein [Kitasatospora sp. NPDC088134]|uniref:SpaA isopeptide-forming pilin-related protein n=1 Tax=Kitasatospora sp. NPDC088134 TaxID=3364071 RepID=UPI00382719D8